MHDQNSYILFGPPTTIVRFKISLVGIIIMGAALFILACIKM